MGNDWIDAEGFRANVGIILANSDNKLLLGGRVGAKGWQFPQGGMEQGEEPVEAMFRELHEEVGLVEADVEVLDVTSDWLRYKLPKRLMRRSEPRCIGQKQMWYLLRLESDEDRFDLGASDTPEFDHWEWVDYWYPVDKVVFFKRRVYQCALAQLESRLPSMDSFANG
jgi:putative (di)nucleoside polyphosphate hydrolase